MDRIKTIAILFVVFCAALVGQEITLTGPPAPIAIGALDVIFVSGLTDEEFQKSAITVQRVAAASIVEVVIGAVGDTTPAQVIRGNFGGQPALFFRAGKNGSYTVTVGQNVQHLEWQKSLGVTLQQATDVNLTGDILERLKKLSVDAALAFPSRGGSCVVVVGPPNPVPIPVPVPTPDEPSAQLQTLVAPIREALRANPAKSEKLKSGYAGLSDVVRKDAGSFLKDTAALQKLHAKTLDELRATDPPMVGAQIDQAIASYLGINKTAEGYELKALTPADVSKFADFCAALSWAAGKAALNQ